MQRIPMTPEGHLALQSELAHLREVVRPQIVRDIETAREHGDISENSEFEDAKHRQALCEGRIQEIGAKLSAAEVIDIRQIPASDRVIFGVTVEVEDQETEEISTYKIVGTDEADIKAGKLSVTSPLARALIGKEVGDEVVVTTPKGQRRVNIVTVLHR